MHRGTPEGIHVRVAIDVTPMVGGPGGVRTGIGQTVAALMDALPPLAAQAGIELLPYALSVRARGAQTQLPPDTRFVPIPARILLPAWARTGRPRIDRWLGRPDVIHATNYLTPPARRAVVWTHDVAFLRDASLGSADVRLYGETMRRAARRGALFVTGASVIADDIRSVLGADMRNGADVAVVPLALPPLPQPTVTRVGPENPYVLALGTCEPRKNLPRLVQAFGRIADQQPDLHLVLAGPEGPDRANVTAAIATLDPKTQDRIHIPGAVTDAERAALLRDAEVLAYPSLAEGFGLPMLEAMASHTPVVAGDAGSIPEVAGDAAVLVDPYDVDAIAAALLRVVDDVELRAELVARGDIRASVFTVDAMARGLIGCYQRAMS